MGAERLDLFLGLAAAGLQNCPERTRRHGVHPHALFDQLLGQGLGVGDDPALGRGVVQEDVRRLIGLDRGRGDDGRAWRQMRRRRLTQPVQGVEIGLQGGVEILGRDLAHTLAELLAARVDDQDVQTAESLERALHHSRIPRLVTHVARQRQRFDALGLDQGDHFACVRLFRRQIGDGDIGALAGVGDGDGAADAGVSPGDQSAAAFQAAVAAIGLLPMIRLGLHRGDQARRGLRLTRKRWARILMSRILHGQAVGHEGCL
ncbi:hypothetical protein D3C80_786740 [compost metagenome]